MTYDPITYWRKAGADPANSEHETHFRRTDVFARQEDRLMAVLETLDSFDSILEVGCGWGRITKLVSERWPDKPYLALDLSPERAVSAQRKAPRVEFEVGTIQDFDPMGTTWDLVLTTECLMHIVPAEIAGVVRKLLDLSSGYVVSLDWDTPLYGVQIAPWNFLHPYAGLYGDAMLSKHPTDLQAIFIARGLHSGADPA